MTNKPMLSVERELLESAVECLERCQDQAFQSCECEQCLECGEMPDGCSGTECAKNCQCSTCEHCCNEQSIKELRALLDKQESFELVEPVAPWFYFVECDDPDYSGLFNHENEAQTQANDNGGHVVRLWNVPPTWKPAARHQGDPVSWVIDTVDGRGADYYPGKGLDTLEIGAKLYAEQPAPVAVVMPERMKERRAYSYDLEVNYEDGKAFGYNAALDDVARLNGVNP